MQGRECLLATSHRRCADDAKALTADGRRSSMRLDESQHLHHHLGLPLVRGVFFAICPLLAQWLRRLISSREGLGADVQRRRRASDALRDQRTSLPGQVLSLSVQNSRCSLGRGVDAPVADRNRTCDGWRNRGSSDARTRGRCSSLTAFRDGSQVLRTSRDEAGTARWCGDAGW